MERDRSLRQKPVSEALKQSGRGVGKLSGKEFGGLEEFVEVGVLPHIGSATCPVYAAHRGVGAVGGAIDISHIGCGGEEALQEDFVGSQRVTHLSEQGVAMGKQDGAEVVSDAHPVAAFAEVVGIAAAEAGDFLQKQDQIAHGSRQGMGRRAFVFEMTGEEVIARDLALEVTPMGFVVPKRDKLPAGMLIEETVHLVLRLDGEIHAREQVIVGVGSGGVGLCKEQQFGLHLTHIAPTHLHALRQHMVAGTLHLPRSGMGIERFGPSVDVQENVVARVVEQVEQSVEHRGLIVGNDEIGVFHRERFFKRRRVKESLRLLDF